jgi:alginate O-acetyltransferase complex protein AlgI
MIFNSFAYIIFIIVISTLYYFFPGKYRWIWLLTASIAYYLSFIPIFFGLLAAIVLVNYVLSMRLGKMPEGKNTWMMIVIVLLNIAVLGLFKYFNILFPNNQLHLYNVNFFFPVDPINKMILPLGLSYVVFTVLSYQIEIKRNNIQPEKHLGFFSLYLLFFPKIAQGPIERPQKFLSQLHMNRPFNYPLIVEGLKQMLMGYFKKLVVADRLAIYVNAVYSNSTEHNGTTLVIATIFFAFQIYADFSGYTDIALGSAKIFGFNLTNNFKRPYLATSIKDFWDRWHITFSTWLRDYIFLPLAYSITARLKRSSYLSVAADKWVYLISIMVTFAVCGIWHGVGWTYLLWGIIFGGYLTYSNWTKNFHKKIRRQLKIKKTSKYYVLYKVLTTFILVSFAWIFFRAESINEAFFIIKKIFTSPGPVFYENPSNIIFALFGIAALMLIDIKHEYLNRRWSILNNHHNLVRITGIIVIVLTILLIGVFDGGQFIYFQF